MNRDKKQSWILIASVLALTVVMIGVGWQRASAGGGDLTSAAANVETVNVNRAIQALDASPAVSGVGDAISQTDGDEDDSDGEGASEGEVEFFELDYDPFDAAAEAIGIDTETLWSEVDSGKSIAEVAAANGVDVQTVIDAMSAAEQQFIDSLLADGAITAEEAAEWKAETAEFIDELVNETVAFADYGVDFEGKAAEVIGVDVETLWTELDSGKSLADVAEANGVASVVVVDALVGEEMAFIDELLANGDITEEEAAEMKAEASNWITYEVNTAFVDPFIMAAKLLGLDEESLWAELDSGKSLAEIATANSVDPQTLIDAGIEAENKMIDDMLAAELITQEEADEWRSEVAEYVPQMVNEPIDFFEMEFDEECDEDHSEDLDLDSEGSDEG